MSSLEAQLDENTRTELKRLTSPPQVAWPTVIMLAVSLTVILASYAAGFLRLVPLWAAGLVNMLVMYNLFSVIHDGIHRSISRNQKVNDWCARLAGQGMSPGTVLGLFRWGHIQHHRFTTGAGDPDNWLHGGRVWTLPLRWSVIDLYYLTHAIRTRDRIAAKHLPAAFVGTAFIFTTAGVLAALGFWREVLMLWLLPTRLNSVLLGFTFFWLPHVPHKYTAAEDPYRATTLRLGLEWLMTPLLQFQNYHLIHHLYPRTPFYRYGQVWRLLEPYLRRHTLAIQHGWHILPVEEGPEEMRGARR